MEQQALAIDNMSCGHCVARVKKTLEAVPGVTVSDVQIGSARVEAREQDAVAAAIQALGRRGVSGARVLRPWRRPIQPHGQSHGKRRRDRSRDGRRRGWRQLGAGHPARGRHDVRGVLGCGPAVAEQQPGVRDASVNLMLKSATVMFDPAASRRSAWSTWCRKTGYEAHLPLGAEDAIAEQASRDRAIDEEFRDLRRRPSFAGVAGAARDGRCRCR